MPVAATNASEFPLKFDSAADAGLTWDQEAMHWPHQLTPLSFSVLMETFMAGRRDAQLLHRRPYRSRGLRINTYYYEAVEPVAGGDEAAEMMRAAETNARRDGERLDELWWGVHLPRVIEVLAELVALRGGRGWDASLADLARAELLVRELWCIHFSLATPWFLPVCEFEELHEQLFPDQPPLAAYSLLRGFGNLTLDCAVSLHRLAGQAPAPVRQQILQRPADAVMSFLEQTPAHRDFLGRLRVHLEEFGGRGDMIDVAHSSWIEEPAPMLRMLRSYISGEAGDPTLEQDRLAAERDQAIADRRSALAGYPEPVRSRFASQLAAAQIGLRVSEDHNFYIDYRSTYEMRRLLLDIGSQLAARGQIGAMTDVFMLTLDEIRDSAGAPLAAIVDARRGEMTRWQAVTPPPTVGAPAPQPVPGEAPVGLARIGAAFYGSAAPPLPAGALAAGHPACGGKAIGRARLVTSAAAALRLGKGDVLLAATIATTWTAAFSKVAAIVTDVGGPLSHCAVLAREFGIPAVVGAGDATSRIEDGQLVEVDGDARLVRALP